MFDYLIYHKNCIDGFMGAVVAKHSGSLEADVFIYADEPSSKNTPPSIAHKKVVIIDVAYHPDTLQKICSSAKHVTYIDHHVSHIQEIKDLKIENLEIVYDPEYSGCYLAWRFFNPKKDIPKVIKYISDNDTGTWKYKYTNAVITTITVQYRIHLKEIENWYKLLDDNLTKSLIKKGKIFMEYNEHLLRKSLTQYTLKTFPSVKLRKHFPELSELPKYTVSVHSGACPTTTQVGNFLSKNTECDFVIIFSFNLEENKLILSFRSTRVNVGKIAKILGGGGHKYAAACRLDMSILSISDIFFVK